MKVPFPALVPASTVALKAVNLAGLTPKQLACLLLAPPSHLSIDCGGLLTPHPLGVGRFVSQLLLLRRRGTCVQLCNVNPVLRRCLHLLALGTLFQVNG